MPFVPRPTVLLALAVLAAAPAAAQETTGGGSRTTQGAARPVDECGAPSERPQNRGTSQRQPAATRPEPRLLGQPAASVTGSGSAAGAQTQPGGAGQQASTPHPNTDPSAAGTPSGAPSQASAQPSGQPARASSSATPGAAATQQAAGLPAAGTPSGASSQASAQPSAHPAGASSSATPGAATGQPAAGQASSMQSRGSPSIMTAGQPGTQASGHTADVPSYSGTSADAAVDARSARHNRNLLRLPGAGAGAGLRLGPAASVSVPTAFGVDAGEAFFGVAYQGRTRYTEEDDAAAVIGFGIGTRRLVALEAALTTYSTFRDTPLATGGISFKLHHQAPRQMSFAVGWENAILWGGSDDRGSLYATGTRLLTLRQNPEQPFSAAVVTLGLGSGRFRFESDEAADRRRINLFGALGVRVTGPLSLVTDWTGQDLNLALSATPIRRIPFVVTAGVADLTGQAGDGARFILSLGYGLSFRQPL